MTLDSTIAASRPNIIAIKLGPATYRESEMYFRAGTHGEISFDSVDSRSSSVYVNVNFVLLFY